MIMNKVSLAGVEVFPFASVEVLLDYVDECPGILVAVNAEKILHATDETKRIINSGIGYCDGIGAVYATRRKGHPEVQKIAGCELWLHIVARYHESKTFYLVGAKLEVIQEVVERLSREYAGIRIVGFRDGYIHTDEERRRLIEDIATKKPNVVFVAMGSPKQELLMQEMQEQHRAIYQGLGGSFDVYTGRVERAPRWWIEHNLEFAYRLLRQPKRILRQVHLIRFLWRVLTNQI